MPVKIRLARHGRKKFAYYHIVVADSRAPRDGNYIERIGMYNPNTNPATIELDFDKALDWLTKGAQPTDTTRAILSYRGVMMKKHLLEGVKKGAFDETEAERRFIAWKQEKDAKIQAKVDKLNNDASTDAEKRLAAEAKVNEARATELAKRKSDLAAEVQAAKAAEEAKNAPVEEVKEEAPVAAVVKEEAPAVEETPAAEEVKEEAPVVEKTPAAEEVKEETPVVEETPAAEEAKEEAPVVEEEKKKEE